MFGVARNTWPMLHILLETNPTGKRPLERPRMIWEDLVKKYVKFLGGDLN